MEKIYSINGQDEWMDFDDIYNTIESDYEIDEIKEIRSIYQGDKITMTHDNFINAKSIIEEMQTMAYDDNEFAEDYLEDLSKEDILSLEKVLKAWFDTVAEQPRFYSVDNIQEIPYSHKEEL